MILILSTELDHTTDEVIDWISFYGGKWRRLNGEDYTNGEHKLKIDLDHGLEICLDSEDDILDGVNVVWSRRWHRFLEHNNEFRRAPKSRGENLDRVLKYLKNEFSVVSSLLYKRRDDEDMILWFDHPGNQRLNKMDTLVKAEMCGLTVPDTLITNNIDDLKCFCKLHSRVISKPIHNIDRFVVNNELYMPYTKEVDLHILKRFDIGEVFYLTLFQEYIEKDLEVRVFFIDNEFYSMAIFSQSNSKTQVDFRNYDSERWNRMVPYKLPDKIENEISSLMSMLNLKHGSIDLIKTKDGDFYFLEVNPVGQFGMVSYPCNYRLEKHLAEKLIWYDRQTTGC